VWLTHDIEFGMLQVCENGLWYCAFAPLRGNIGGGCRGVVGSSSSGDAGSGGVDSGGGNGGEALLKKIHQAKNCFIQVDQNVKISYSTVDFYS